MAALGIRVRGLGATFRRAVLLLAGGQQTQTLTGNLASSGSVSHIVFKLLTGTV